MVASMLALLVFSSASKASCFFSLASRLVASRYDSSDAVCIFSVIQLVHCKTKEATIEAVSQTIFRDRCGPCVAKDMVIVCVDLIDQGIQSWITNSFINTQAIPIFHVLDTTKILLLSGANISKRNEQHYQIERPKHCRIPVVHTRKLYSQQH